MTGRQLIILASLSAMLAVAFGAVGSHALREVLESQGRMQTYQTAVDYHFYHSLGLFLAGILFHLFPVKSIFWSGVVMLAGTIFFSGSLYAFSLTNNTFFAYITPFGGVLLIFSWLTLAYGLTRSSKTGQ